MKALSRLPALPIPQTRIYKIIGKIEILIDIYVPTTTDAANPPIMLFIHGGGWSGGNRTDYSRPLFYHFLSLGFIVTAMEYRLLPETKLEGQMDDVRDVEPWLRNSLAREVKDYFSEVQSDKIIVVGASAGAHLALLTPKLWTIQPTAILSLYGPTDMNRLPFLYSDRLLKLISSPCTSELLTAGTNYDHPPTELPVVQKPENFECPRTVMILTIFREELLCEYLLRGLTRGEDGKLRLPEKGSITKEEIDEISPFELSKRHKYPPTYQIMGADDDVFELSHPVKFHAALRTGGSQIQTMILFGAGHAFDIGAEIGGEIHEKAIAPAVEWVARIAGVQAKQQRSARWSDSRKLGVLVEKEWETEGGRLFEGFEFV